MSNTTAWSHARTLGWLVILYLFSTVAMARAASPSEQVGGGGAGLSTPVAHATAAASREVLVRFNAGVLPGASMSARAQVGASIVRQFTIVPDLQLLRLPPGMPAPEALALFRQHPAVRYAEPNHLIKALGVPNDFRLDELWGLWNTGQKGGTPGADIDALKAWDLTTGSRQVVVAVIDAGIDYMHPDLAANMFRNEADCAHDGVDHDGNGFPNDCFGIDFVAAAGNNYGSDNDTTANYPSNYDLPNILAVAAMTRTDALASFSNVGKRTVM
jgi:Subtilase family